MLTDPIADMLTRIRNANLALHDTVEMPASKLKAEIARVLHDEGYIAGYDVQDGASGRELAIRLKYDRDRRRVISGILGGMGVAVVSTSQGVITGHEARRRGIGGEVLCSVW